MSDDTNRDPTSIEEIVNTLRTVQRLAFTLPPGHRQGLLIVALERALSVAEHYDTAKPAAAPRQCMNDRGHGRCVLHEGHPRAHRSAAGRVWS